MESWADSTPTVPGFYWSRCDEDDDARVVHVIRGVSGLRVVISGVEDDHAIDAGPFVGLTWSGPIAKPDRWDSGPPAASGWYWAKGHLLIPSVVAVRVSPARISVAVPGVGKPGLNVGMLDTCVWAGPLRLPE